MQIYKLLLPLTIMLASLSAQASYTLPEYQKMTLPNGMTIYLMEQHEVPLIDINVVVNAGAIDDGNIAGLNYFTARNLTLGTKALTKTELDNTVDFVGTDLFSDANAEFVTVGASLAAKDTALILPIVRDMIIHPRFDESEFTKLKQRHLLNLEQNKESPKSVINAYFNRVIFGNKGYGVTVKGNVNTINAITLEQIKQHHKTWYQPNNTAVIVVGDFEAEKMLKELKSLFQDWENTATPKRKQITKTAEPNNSTVLLVNKSDAREATFLIGGKGIAQGNQDKVGLSVVNTILGGRFTSWLNDELRVNAGLTYGARSSFTSFSEDGVFALSSFTKTETTIEALDLALKTYARLWEKGIDDKTLRSAKAYVKGQFPPKFETSEQLASLLANMHGYQFNEEYINTFEQQVDSLTIEKTKQLINQYFPQKNLQFIVIGEADALRDKLKKYGQVSEININDVGFNLTKHLGE